MAPRTRAAAIRAGVPNNDIDGVVLPSLTAEDLKDLGITSVGHRRRLLEAIAALHESGKPAVVELVAEFHPLRTPSGDS